MTTPLQLLQALLNAGVLDIVLELATNPIFAIMVVAIAPYVVRILRG